MADRSAQLNIFVLTFSLLFVLHSFADCVDERKVLGSGLLDGSFNTSHYLVKNENGQFVTLDKRKINPLNIYTLQLSSSYLNEKADFNQYNKKYIEYYRYARIQEFLNLVENDLTKLDYKYEIIGKSLEGRNLYSVTPRNYDLNKKTILMFGRHHGDEGTANWIIEGFVNSFLKQPTSFHAKYQLVLIPMINPDGAEAQSRYNSKNRDLNRSWHKKVRRSKDEAKIVNQFIQPYLSNSKNIPIVLDMHGSFTLDFFFRVKRGFKGSDFFNHQQQFIDMLQTFDSFQDGNYKATNGDPGMARIVMVSSYDLNALTHETPRDIKLRNSRNRSKTTLFEQGEALLLSIQRLY